MAKDTSANSSLMDFVDMKYIYTQCACLLCFYRAMLWILVLVFELNLVLR